MISFIIPAHNEEALIGATLDALRAAVTQLGPPEGAEVIVVDDGSSDRTAEVARAAGAVVVRVDLRHIAAARNAGAAAARGDLLVFVDADTLVPSATVQAVVDVVAAGAVAGGAPARLAASDPWWARAAWAPVEWAMVALGLPGGAFMFATRAAFDEAGGFDEQWFASEEIHLGRALKRIGPFRMVRPPVITSGRKFHLHTPLEMTRLWLRILRNGPAALKDRSGLGFWYGGRRK